ncbi:MAG: membrane protein insertion efficiency factor YidD [Ignavibacteriaceae bacterium]
MKLFLCIFIFSSTIIFAQTDWQKWGKANYSYAVKDNFHRRDLSFDAKNPERFVLKSLLDSYWFFISDVDGDNCAFSPTCSNFFLQSVSKTNLVQGTLMFFDRFTRDMDFISKFDFYPRVPDGHFYDPISLYTLNKNEIKYIPPSVIVNNE